MLLLKDKLKLSFATNKTFDILNYLVFNLISPGKCINNSYRFQQTFYLLRTLNTVCKGVHC